MSADETLSPKQFGEGVALHQYMPLLLTMPRPGEFKPRGKGSGVPMYGQASAEVTMGGQKGVELEEQTRKGKRTVHFRMGLGVRHGLN